MDILESAAIRTQEAAGRAWADLLTNPTDAGLRWNYEQAKQAQDVAYSAWIDHKLNAELDPMDDVNYVGHPMHY